jgi:hypothetical protein
MLIRAKAIGLRYREVPIPYRKDGRGHQPHLRPWRDGWRHLRFMLLFSPRWLFLYPGFTSILLGLAMILWLLPEARVLGKVTLDVHTMLYAAFAVILGFQAVVFAALSRIFATSEGLMPHNQWTRRLSRASTLELGVILGILLVVLGFAGSIWAIFYWERRSFGPLNPVQVMRIIIPAGLAMCLGFQTVLSSFFLGVLRLARR